jgi:transcriptional regulator with XRE-family HTH domain
LDIRDILMDHADMDNSFGIWHTLRPYGWKLGTNHNFATIREHMPNTIYQKPYRAVIEWLKDERKKGGHSMRAIAIALSVPHTWVAKVEGGERRLDLLEYVRLCAVLGADPATGLRMVVEQLGASFKKAAPAAASAAAAGSKARSGSAKKAVGGTSKAKAQTAGRKPKSAAKSKAR